MKKNEGCCYCNPEINDISLVLGYYTDAELVTKRSAVEADGKVFQCGVSKLTCRPLAVIQHEIDRRAKEHK